MRQAPVPLRGLTPADDLAGEDEEDTRLLRELAGDARTYLEGHDWCERVEELWFGGGVGGIVAVFLARHDPPRPDVDAWLWVVVGDVPPLYLVTDDQPRPRDVLQSYVEWRHDWVEAVRAGEPTDDLPPVNVPETREWADQLASRLEFIEREVIQKLD